jgi:hypothetical protein
MSLTMPNGVPQPMDPQAAMTGLRSYAQTKYNKPVTDQQFGDYAKKIGYQGGPVSAEQYKGAEQELDRAYGPPAPKPGPSGPPAAPAAPAPTPLPQNFQYQPQFGTQTAGVMGSILQRPETRDQRWQDARFEEGKESALDYRQQLGQQAQQNAASRGLRAGSGATQAILSGLDQNLTSQLLAGRRQVAGEAAIGNRADQYDAVNAAQEMDQQGFQNQFNTNNQNLALWSAGEDARQGQQSFGLTNWLAGQNVDLENRRFGEQQEQFDQGFGLDFLRFLENKNQFNQQFGQQGHQFNQTMGLNWFNAQNNQQNNFLNWILQSGMV